MTRIVETLDNGQYRYPALSSIGDADVIYAEKSLGNGVFQTSRLLGSTLREARNVAFYGPMDPRFQAWPLGAAVETKAQRKIANAGGTIARAGFVDNVAVFALPGGGMRIWRTATTSSTATAYYAINLTTEETEPFIGNTASVALDMRKGANYSGTGVAIKVYYSEEPQQSIRNADGTYSSGNKTIDDGAAVLPGSDYAGDATTYGRTVSVPTTTGPTMQLCLVLAVDWSGTAGTYDYIEIDFADLQLASAPFVPAFRNMQDILGRATSRMWSSYPYGGVPGTLTPSPLGGIAVNEELNFSYILSPQWPKMEYAPTVYAYSPLDGQDFEAKNKTTGENENTTVFDAGATGAKITNNAYASYGHEYSSHAVAIGSM